MNGIPAPRSLPVGLRSGEIFEAYLASHDWRRSTANPCGLVVRVGVMTDTADGEAALFDVFDAHHLDRVESVFLAAGVAAGSLPLTERLGELVGRTVRFTSRNITPREGRNQGIPRAVVASWVPAR